MTHPTISFGFRRLACAQFVASIVAAILWGSGVFLYSILLAHDERSLIDLQQVILAGIAQITVLLGISLVFLMLFIPNKKRPVATAATLWSATSFARFLASLGASSLLYYAAQFGVRPLLFSFLLTAVLLLICETRVIARDISISTLTKE